MSRLLNPRTGRYIAPGKKAYNDLIRCGFTHNLQTNTLVMPTVQRQNCGGGPTKVSLLDTDIPNIGVEPLKPTTFRAIRNKIVKNAGKMADWLWKLVQNRGKNANDIADWILNQKDKIVNKILPPKVAELIELCKNSIYICVGLYWKLNLLSNPGDEGLVRQKIEADRLKYGKEYDSKYLKMYYYNDIKSLDDITSGLMQTYKKESNAFKLLFSFGYVTEKPDGDEYLIKLYQPSQQYFYDKPKSITNKKDMNRLITKINAGNIIYKLTQKFPDTKTRLIGVYSMAVKVIRLDYPIGSKVQLPEYIKISNNIIGLENTENNLCFWACIALAEGARKDRYITKSKELFNTFYKTKFKDDYEGFDLVNELDAYEAFNTKYAINILSYYEDQSIEYVRKSEFNADRTPIYLNLYLDHFSYIPNLEKLAKMYICNRCSAKFDNNYKLERHIETCKLEQEDTFVKYPQIYEMKRNVIVELCDWFDVNCDFKYDYLIAFDLEAMLQKIHGCRKENEKLTFVTKHIPVSASIATNVCGFEKEYFILSTNPDNIAVLMFEYFDKIVEKSTVLMMDKMKALIEKVSKHYKESEKEKWLETIVSYCSNIPIVGFNSGFYDINLLSSYGFINEILKRDQNPFVIKNGTRYKVIKTKQFTFLDQMNYCAAGTTLRSFVEAYDIGEKKGHFPYEWFDSYEKLDYLISDLKIEDFNSSLKNTTMSPDDFNQLMQTCKSLDLIYVKDLLKWYNNLDVGPLLKACLKQKEFYYTFELDMYKDGFTLPGLSENILFQFAQQGFKEYLKQEPDVNTGHYFYPKDIDAKIESYKSQDRKAGRLLDNYIAKDEVMELLRKQRFVCYYCWNKGTVYNWSLDRINCSKGHTSGNCVIACFNCNRQRKDTLLTKFYRKKALIRFANSHPMINLIDEKNKRVFYKIKNNIVGGPSIVYHRYHEKNKTKINRVHYSLDTKQWYHNNDGKNVSKIVGYDANALYLYCLEQEQLCGKLEWIPTKEEYKIEYEDETKDLNETEKKQYESERHLNIKSQKIQDEINGLSFGYSQSTWLKYLETFFGLIELDIEVPEDKYEYFGEMPPIFKNIEYCEEEGGEYMKKVIMGIRDEFTTSRKLIASLKATRILIKSARLKWLLEKGAVVTKLYGVIPAEQGKPFKQFADWVSDERRKGDRDTRYAIIAEAAKTVGNSAYGRTGMNKNNFKKVKFCTEKQFNRAKNNYFFCDAEEYNGVYEVSSRSRTVQQNMPIQVAFSVLDDAKLRMLEFYYDCVDKYIERIDYQYMYMDTDSAYMALTDDFENLVKPELRNEFEKDRNTWFPRTDTDENKAYDKRKPGLFKTEHEGDGMIALCSKTYYTWGSKDKFSSKGVQNERNNTILKKDEYQRCLVDEKTIDCQNKGFRYIAGTMKTYEQDKIGLTPIYVKGIVMDDGIHIRPLNI